MGDAFKCKSCGTVVETLQSCPSCGETAMRPIQSSADDTAARVDETATTGDGDTDESAAPDASGADDASSAEATETAPTAAAEPDTASGRDQERRESPDESGLLAWLKSLF